MPTNILATGTYDSYTTPVIAPYDVANFDTDPAPAPRAGTLGPETVAIDLCSTCICTERRRRMVVSDRATPGGSIDWADRYRANRPNFGIITWENYPADPNSTPEFEYSHYRNVGVCGICGRSSSTWLAETVLTARGAGEVVVTVGLNGNRSVRPPRYSDPRRPEAEAPAPSIRTGPGSLIRRRVRERSSITRRLCHDAQAAQSQEQYEEALRNAEALVSILQRALCAYDN